ncbi:MAG: hypothetical protein ACE1ZJ_05540, partial [Nitrospirales bacterium]
MAIKTKSTFKEVWNKDFNEVPLMTLRPDVKLIPPRGSNLVHFGFLIRNCNHAFEVMIKWSYYRCRQATFDKRLPPLFPFLSGSYFPKVC